MQSSPVFKPVFAKVRHSSQIIPNHFDETLLIKEIYRHTNKARDAYNLSLFLWNDTLTYTAHDHSQDMVNNHYIAHISPKEENRTLQKRLENHGFHFTNHTFAENIGVNYMLDIAGRSYYEKSGWFDKPVYIDYNTGETIDYQTYDHFAKTIVDQWMKSPGHRKNILNPQMQQIGIGAIQGKYQNFDAIYVTQVFLGIMDLPIRKKQIPSSERVLP